MADIVKVLADIDAFGPSNAGNEITWIEPEENDVLYVKNAGKGFYMLVNNKHAANTPLLTFDTPGATTPIEVPVDDYVHTAAVETLIQLGPFTPVTIFNTLSDDVVAPLSIKCTISGTTVAGDLQIALITVP